MARIDYMSCGDQVWGFTCQMDGNDIFFERLSPLDAVLPPTPPRPKGLKKGQKVTRKIRHADVGLIFN